jgi:hypothetical protein
MNLNGFKKGDMFIEFEVIFDYGFEAAFSASFKFSLKERVILGNENDLIQLDKDISKHCLKRELIAAPLNKKVHRNGIILIRRN